MAKSKQIPAIDCDGPAQAGITLVLNWRFEEMCKLRSRALDWSTPDGVHDMRVASRRLRGALKDFMPYLPKRRVAGCQEQIRTIAKALGRVRDYDVEIMTLEEIAGKAPAEFSPGILRFVESRQVAREEARAKVLLPLAPDVLEKLRIRFSAALEGLSSQRRKGPKQKQQAATLTYRQVARAVIINRLEDIGRFSESLYHPLKVKPLHEMRISAKTLRYALELFGHCWGPSLSSVAKKVAELQSSLGKLHDCDVWIKGFGNAATHQVPAVDSEYRATAVWLLGHFLKLRSKHVGKALAQWSDWEADEVSAQLRQTILSESSAASLTIHTHVL
jgi:CHAD domain-containing protein